MPRKRIVGGVITYHRDKLLIVKPTYRDYWLIPGGVVEAAESPLLCARREFREEIGFDLEIERLLCVDHATQTQPFIDEALHFLFRGRDLQDEDVARIRLQVEELSEFRFVDRKEAMSLVSRALSRRIEAIWNLRAGPLFLENGREGAWGI